MLAVTTFSLDVMTSAYQAPDGRSDDAERALHTHQLVPVQQTGA